MTVIRIGALRQRMVLEEPSRTPDGGGGADDVWSEVAQVWAALKPISGTERLEADALAGRITHNIWIRHVSGVGPHMRFRLGTRLFDIRAVINVEERDAFIRCLVEERDL